MLTWELPVPWSIPTSARAETASLSSAQVCHESRIFSAVGCHSSRSPHSPGNTFIPPHLIFPHTAAGCHGKEETTITVTCVHVHTVVYCIKLCLWKASTDGSWKRNCVFTFMICWPATLLRPTQCQKEWMWMKTVLSGRQGNESASPGSLKWGRELDPAVEGRLGYQRSGRQGCSLSDLTNQSELSEPSLSISSGIVHRPAALKWVLETYSTVFCFSPNGREGWSNS